jgi:hypothetical protein
MVDSRWSHRSALFQLPQQAKRWPFLGANGVTAAFTAG